jgi:hypothetical protein
MGHLTKAEVETIWSFQRKTGARSVKFAAWPTNVGLDPNLDACSSAAAAARFTDAAPLGISGLRRDAPINLSGLWR